jgi:hypothetical protein
MNDRRDETELPAIRTDERAYSSNTEEAELTRLLRGLIGRVSLTNFMLLIIILLVLPLALPSCLAFYGGLWWGLHHG